jgi:hypothetical protein
MIGGDRPDLSGQFRAAPIGELIGVELRPETRVLTSLEDASRLLQAEG